MVRALHNAKEFSTVRLALLAGSPRQCGAMHKPHDLFVLNYFSQARMLGAPEDETLKGLRQRCVHDWQLQQL
jgi:hypothetical protein